MKWLDSSKPKHNDTNVFKEFSEKINLLVTC